MGKYPDCFPENFETEILPKGAQKIIGVCIESSSMMMKLTVKIL